MSNSMGASPSQFESLLDFNSLVANEFRLSELIPWIPTYPHASKIGRVLFFLLYVDAIFKFILQIVSCLTVGKHVCC